MRGKVSGDNGEPFTGNNSELGYILKLRYTMDDGLFGVRFLFLGHKNRAASPVDYLSAFAADSPFFYVFFNKIMLYFLIGKR